MVKFIRHILTSFFLILLFTSYSFAQLSYHSEKAAQIEYGMPLINVIKLLGIPDWLVFSNDQGDFASDIPPDMYKLIWRNERCSPVVVLVNNTSDTVTGWDEGKAGCEGGYSSMEFPDHSYSLKNGARYDFYQAKVVDSISAEPVDNNFIGALEKERKRLELSMMLLEKDYAELNQERDDLIKFKAMLSEDSTEEMHNEYKEKLQNLNDRIDIYKADKHKYEQELTIYNERLNDAHDNIGEEDIVN